MKMLYLFLIFFLNVKWIIDFSNTIFEIMRRLFLEKKKDFGAWLLHALSTAALLS